MYEYKGKIYPDFLKEGNACQYITPVAKKFCIGRGVDIGANDWCLPGAEPIDLENGFDATKLPQHILWDLDYVFSSHCLEHIADPIQALKHWKGRLKNAGVLFLYLPHPDMEYWLPQNNLKHLHSWYPKDMAKILEDLGFCDVIYSERDLAWGFSVVGYERKDI